MTVRRRRPLPGRLSDIVGWNNCCRQQQSFPSDRDTLEGNTGWRNEMSNRATRTALKMTALKTHAAANGKRMAIGKACASDGKARALEDDGEIGLDGLLGHAGYAVRRFQIWI